MRILGWASLSVCPFSFSELKEGVGDVWFCILALLVLRIYKLVSRVGTERKISHQLIQLSCLSGLDR